MRIPQELTSKLVLTILALAIASSVVGTAVAVPMIRSADIVNETILSEDIKNGEVKTVDLANGAVQLQVTQRDSPIATIPPGGSATMDAVCLSGESLVGGGYFTGGVGLGKAKENRPDGNAWHVVVINEGTVDPIGAVSHALCAKVTP